MVILMERFSGLLWSLANTDWKPPAVPSQLLDTGRVKNEREKGCSAKQLVQTIT